MWRCPTLAPWSIRHNGTISVSISEIVVKRDSVFSSSTTLLNESANYLDGIVIVLAQVTWTCQRVSGKQEYDFRYKTVVKEMEESFVKDIMNKTREVAHD